MSHEDLVRNLKAVRWGQVDERVEETGGHTSTNQPSEDSTTPAPVNLSKQDCRNAELAHARRSFKTLADLKDGNAVGPTVRDANGVAQYWLTNGQGIKQLTPAWEEGFEANMKFWAEDFLHQCRVELEMPALVRDYLKTVTDEAFLKALKDGAWKTYSANAKKAACGTFEQSRETKNQNNRENSRRSTKATQRAKASQGTCVGTGLSDFAFLYRTRAQSLSVADKGNLSREVVLVPSYVSDEALTIKEALDLKVGSKSTKSLVYVKFNEPVPKLGGSCTWPDWSISKAWKLGHPEEYKKSMHLIDPQRTVMPNVTEFTQLYKAPREYLPSIPSGVQLPEDDNRHSSTAALAHDGHSATRSNHVEDSPVTSETPVIPGTNEQFQVGEVSELPLPPPAVPQLAVEVTNATDTTNTNTTERTNITTNVVDVQKPSPYELQLNGGHYVNGEFIATPPTPDTSGDHMSARLFGVTIDPKHLKQDQHVAVGPSTSPQKRTAEGSETMSKRRKKGASDQPPRRSTRLQISQMDEDADRDGKEAIGGGGTEKIILKISRK
ncbi:hypothetical protein RSAG8_12584, partial [Rhizoctonia solani AG-8 WAC10335]